MAAFSTAFFGAFALGTSAFVRVPRFFPRFANVVFSLVPSFGAFTTFVLLRVPCTFPRFANVVFFGAAVFTLRGLPVVLPESPYQLRIRRQSAGCLQRVSPTAWRRARGQAERVFSSFAEATKFL